ncbi:Fibrinogen C domain-containing protein 1 [Portunus trituberculatus]|uniref:Fibrinogen C domain-containing protein 1 n=2 Tax=Portunus trituberculatus TaxID=210409 RepID=A0A5B7CU70_PORTR|nr:Fibrinogen C domain-containing protein 1 [Portunus trituberculatus]
MLQRLSDRLSGIEVLQRQQTERIGTINYRLTKLELQAEERKSFNNDLSNAVRHRMERTDSELDQVNTQLDGIKSSIMNLGQQYVDIKTAVREIPTQDNRGSEVNGLKMQAMVGTLQGLKTATNGIIEDIDQLSHNLTSLNKIASNLTSLSERMVTKQYLLENLSELKNQDSAMSLLARTMVQPQPSNNRRGPRKGEPEDCWQLLRKGRKQSGVYSIQPRYSLTPFFVYCDMETDGGGWTVIQRREDGSVDFLREWADYKHGFGNIAGEYWLGNEKIHLLTNQQVSTLRVDMADYDQQVGHALYSAFAIGSELEGYSLKMLGKYSGDAGDSLRYHVGRRFSTIDVDNDAWPERSCARDHMGAWWYRACETSNLNGRYLHGPIPAEHQYTGLYWYDFRGPQYSLWRSCMMIRRGGKVDHPVFKNFTEIQGQTDSPREEEAVTPRTFDPNQDPYVTFDYRAN